MPAAMQLAESAAAGAAAKQVDLDVQAYQKARNIFVNAIKEHLMKDDRGVTLEALIRSDIVALLCCPLTSDPVQGIQIEALKSIGKIGKADKTTAEAVSRSGVVDSMVMAQTHRNPRIQEAANRSLCSLSESSRESAQTVLDTGMLVCIKQQLDGTEAAVKESGLDAVASIASGSAAMAEAIVDQELLDAVVQHLKFPESPASLITSACTALANAASHDLDLARRVFAAGPVPAIVALLNNTSIRDPRLHAAALRCLSQIAKHDTKLATSIVAAGSVAPTLRFAIDDLQHHVRHAAAAVLQQLASRTPLLTEMVASEGCVSALVKSLKLDQGSSFALPSITALGHIASFAPTFANAVIDADAVPEIIIAIGSKVTAVHTAAAWAVHNMALHGGVVVDKLAAAGVLPPLLKLYCRSLDGSETRVTAKAALKEVIRHCSHQAPLLALVSEDSPPELAKKALKQGYELMKASVSDRREFLTTGALMIMQRMEPTLDGKGQDYVKAINRLFPADVVTYYRTGLTA